MPNEYMTPEIGQVIPMLMQTCDDLTRNALIKGLTQKTQEWVEGGPELADILLEGKKTLEECVRYVTEKAACVVSKNINSMLNAELENMPKMKIQGKEATMAGGAIDAEQVFEWAQEYYYDPKAKATDFKKEAENKAAAAKREAERKKNEAAKKAKNILAKEPLAILLDIGGGTVDPIVLEDGVPKPDYHVSLSEGIIGAYNEISAEIKARSGRDVTEPVISNVLTGKPARVNEADAQFIRERIQRYADNLLMKLTEQKLPFGSSYVLLMGGGSKVIRACWKDSRHLFGKLDHIGDIRANAMGYEEMAFRALLRG